MLSHIEKSRRQYYNAFSLIERNCSVSGVLDITPFLVYFADAVYHQLGDALPPAKTTANFEQALAQGRVTEKEKTFGDSYSLPMRQTSVFHQAV